MIIMAMHDFHLFPRKADQHHSNPSLWPNHWCGKSWSWPVLWRPTTPSRTKIIIIKKDILFIIGDQNVKIGSQEIPWITGRCGLGVQNEAEKRLTEFCQESTLVIASSLFQQSKRRLYLWTSPDGEYQNHTDYILCSQRWKSSIQSAKTRLEANCGSDHEILIAKFRLK